MSQSLGERLRDARESKGLSIGDVAEQTRISALYLESIENNDYSPLPGGIFNKGFVKSYAKFVGIDENEALAEYARLTYVPTDENEEEQLRVYRPEVLTDDNSGRSMIPNAILAVVVLGVLTAGVLYFVDYMRRSPESAETNRPTPTPLVTGENSAGDRVALPTPPATSPEMATLKIELNAVSQPVRITGTRDGEKLDTLVKPGTPFLVEPKQEFTANYNRWNASAIQMSINGESIALPSEPLDPKDGGRIVFTISSETLPEIWSRRAIGKPSATPTPETADSAAEATPTPPPPTATRPTPIRTPVKPPTPVERPTNAQPSENVPARPSDPTRSAPANVPRQPATNPSRPTSNRPAANRAN